MRVLNRTYVPVIDEPPAFAALQRYHVRQVRGHYLAMRRAGMSRFTARSVIIDTLWMAGQSKIVWAERPSAEAVRGGC